MTHDAEECAREDFGIALDVMSEAIRKIVAASTHLSFPYAEMIAALLCAAHGISGVRFEPEEVSRFVVAANEIIDAVEDQEEFEAEATSGLEDLPTADVAPRVILTKGDVSMIAEKVVELLKQPQEVS